MALVKYKTVKSLKCPTTDEWLMKVCYINIVLLAAARKDETSLTWMVPEYNMLSEVRRRKANTE